MKTIATLAIALLCTTAQAQYTGTEMLADLREGGLGYIKAGKYAQGVIEGATLAQMVAESPRIFCLPRDLSTARVIEIVRRRLEDEPLIDRHQPAVGFVILAAGKEWPCKLQARNKAGGNL